MKTLELAQKVSGLTVSPFGIRYRSCKDKTVSEVTIGFDEDLKQYCRLAVILPDQTVDTVIDVTDAFDAANLSYDWTEVVLLGQNEAHNTVTEPLCLEKTERSFIPSEIYRRFSEFEEGVNLFVDVAMTKGGGAGETGTFRRVNSLISILGKLPNHELVRHEESGVAVRYIFDPKQNTGHTTSAGSNPAVSSTTFCALVHKRERYDFKTRQAWSSSAPKFGIPFGSRVLSIEVLLPDNLVVPNQYRDSLLDRGDKALC